MNNFEHVNLSARTHKNMAANILITLPKVLDIFADIFGWHIYVPGHTIPKIGK